eukprot:GHVP01045513.1.p1 GENE.GHVP01045513.1~~GHVP01045513.1.p1  ORF type:complete len:428 (+),score=78.39 GHVP01045513.1:3334-4617(+)
MQSAAASGQWLVFENCHVSEGCIMELNKGLSKLRSLNSLDDSFRLFFISKYESTLSNDISRDSLKILYSGTLSSKELIDRLLDENGTNKSITTTKFKLALFHAAVIEKAQLGAHGWQDKPQFGVSDFKAVECVWKSAGTSIDDEEGRFAMANLVYGGRSSSICDQQQLIHLAQGAQNVELKNTTMCATSFGLDENSQVISTIGGMDETLVNSCHVQRTQDLLNFVEFWTNCVKNRRFEKLAIEHPADKEKKDPVALPTMAKPIKPVNHVHEGIYSSMSASLDCEIQEYGKGNQNKEAYDYLSSWKLSPTEPPALADFRYIQGVTRYLNAVVMHVASKDEIPVERLKFFFASEDVESHWQQPIRGLRIYGDEGKIEVSRIVLHVGEVSSATKIQLRFKSAKDMEILFPSQDDIIEVLSKSNSVYVDTP